MEKLAAMLRGLGFSDYESRIYVHLLRESPKTGYQLSQATGIHRANTYQALRTLGLEPGATASQIEAAYRARARQNGSLNGSEKLSRARDVLRGGGGA